MLIRMQSKRETVWSSSRKTIATGMFNHFDVHMQPLCTLEFLLRSLYRNQWFVLLSLEPALVQHLLGIIIFFILELESLPSSWHFGIISCFFLYFQDIIFKSYHTLSRNLRFPLLLINNVISISLFLRNRLNMFCTIRRTRAFGT